MSKYSMTQSVEKTRPPALGTGSQSTLQFTQLSLGTAVITAAVSTDVFLYIFQKNMVLNKPNQPKPVVNVVKDRKLLGNQDV